MNSRNRLIRENRAQGGSNRKSKNPMRARINQVINKHTVQGGIAQVKTPFYVITKMIKYLEKEFPGTDPTDISDEDIKSAFQVVGSSAKFKPVETELSSDEETQSRVQLQTDKWEQRKQVKKAVKNGLESWDDIKAKYGSVQFFQTAGADERTGIMTYQADLGQGNIAQVLVFDNSTGAGSSTLSITNLDEDEIEGFTVRDEVQGVFLVDFIPSSKKDMFKGEGNEFDQDDDSYIVADKDALEDIKRHNSHNEDSEEEEDKDNMYESNSVDMYMQFLTEESI